MINVLQLFAQYLHNEENWAYRLIRALPDVQNTIASKYFLKCNYYDPAFRFVEFPLRSIERPRRGLVDRACNWLLSRTLRWYPRYLEYYLQDIDVIHSHFAYVGWDYRHLFERRRIPHIVSFYGADYCIREWGPQDPGEFFECFDLVLCEGQYGARRLIDMGCPEGKVLIQHLGVNVASIDFCSRSKPSNQLNLLQVATFREKKGQVYTMEAFIKALPECPNMSLTFVGGDPEGLRRPIIEMAQRQAKDRVRFIDAIPFESLHRFMRDYHVFIHPSCHARNGYSEGGAPVVLLDAQATGMPVIATEHCDIPEEVLNGKTGILAKEKDTDALAEAITRFYRMPEQVYHQMVQEARRHIESEYDCVRSGQQLRSKYEKVIEAGCSRK